MSRIGKAPVAIPQGTKVHVAEGRVRVEGPKGKLERALPPDVALKIDGSTLKVERKDDGRRARSMHGLTRQLVANMVDGVAKGFTRILEINGVGYRAEPRGKILFLTLGYSHPIAYQLPEGVTAKVDRQVVITLEGPDREVLGEAASAIRGLRGPEPYKGKGVKYAEETIKRKAGKSAAGAAR